MNEEYGWIFSLIFKEIFYIHPSNNSYFGGEFTEFEINGQIRELFSTNQMGTMKRKIKSGIELTDNEKKKVFYVIDKYFDENSEIFNRIDIDFVLGQINLKYSGITNDVERIPNTRCFYKEIVSELVWGCINRNLVVVKKN